MNKKSYHLIGIGGEGMSAIAEILHKKGHIVSGSDLTSKKSTQFLSSLGIKIFIGQNEENIKDQDIVIYTSAVKEDNPEFIKAKRLKKETLVRPLMLGKLMAEYKNRIAVSGVHGKTTTTTLIDKILSDAHVDITSLIGSSVEELGGNLRYGNGDTFLTEACEAFRSFLHLKPSIAVITNIDADHLDNYGTIEAIEATFKEFTKKIDKDGTIIYNGDDYRLINVVKGNKRKCVSYGISENNYFCAKNIKEAGKYICYDLYIDNKFIDNIKLQAIGVHNVYNSLAAICCAYEFNVDISSIKDTLKNFVMPNRRFNVVYDEDFTIVDDYAHHPTELTSTLSAAKKHFPDNRLIAVFQPHLYSRTKEHSVNFAKALSLADEIVITDIYAARELPIEGVSYKLISDKIKDKKCTYKELDKIADFIIKNKKTGDLIILLGAGNIDSVYKEMLSKLTGKSV